MCVIVLFWYFGRFMGIINLIITGIVEFENEKIKYDLFELLEIIRQF